MSRFFKRKTKQNPILDFWLNNATLNFTKTEWNIEQFLDELKKIPSAVNNRMEAGWFETSHNFIQIAFVLLTKGADGREPLKEEEVNQLANSENFKNYFPQFAREITRIWGFSLNRDIAGNISFSDGGYKNSYWYKSGRDHNNLRISRFINCCDLMHENNQDFGFNQYSNAFRNFIAKERNSGNFQHFPQDIFFKHWKTNLVKPMGFRNATRQAWQDSVPNSASAAAAAAATPSTEEMRNAVLHYAKEHPESFFSNQTYTPSTSNPIRRSGNAYHSANASQATSLATSKTTYAKQNPEKIVLCLISSITENNFFRSNFKESLSLVAQSIKAAKMKKETGNYDSVIDDNSKNYSQGKIVKNQFRDFFKEFGLTKLAEIDPSQINSIMRNLVSLAIDNQRLNPMNDNEFKKFAQELSNQATYRSQEITGNYR
jgi:hypothetical protein